MINSWESFTIQQNCGSSLKPTKHGAPSTMCIITKENPSMKNLKPLKAPDAEASCNGNSSRSKMDLSIFTQTTRQLQAHYLERHPYSMIVHKVLVARGLVSFKCFLHFCVSLKLSKLFVFKAIVCKVHSIQIALGAPCFVGFKLLPQFCWMVKLSQLFIIKVIVR